MRWCCILVVVVGCDHRPAPKAEPLAVATPDAAPVAAGDDICLQIGARIAEIIISSTTDPTQKAAYEQERTKLVKRFSTSCATESWADTTRGCFLGAKTSADVEACSRALANAAPPAPAPAATGAL